MLVLNFCGDWALEMLLRILRRILERALKKLRALQLPLAVQHHQWTRPSIYALYTSICKSVQISLVWHHQETYAPKMLFFNCRFWDPRQRIGSARQRLVTLAPGCSSAPSMIRPRTQNRILVDSLPKAWSTRLRQLTSS